MFGKTPPQLQLFSANFSNWIYPDKNLVGSQVNSLEFNTIEEAFCTDQFLRG